MRKKPDEENFEEAEAQAWRCWSKTTVPSETQTLFRDPKIFNATPENDKPFYKLVRALKQFTEEYGALPVTSGLPDMKASTGAYVELQKMYRRRAAVESEKFVAFLGSNKDGVTEDMVDAFLKNSHALKLLRGRKWGALDTDKEALGWFPLYFFICFFLTFVFLQSVRWTLFQSNLLSILPLVHMHRGQLGPRTAVRSSRWKLLLRKRRNLSQKDRIYLTTLMNTSEKCMCLSFLFLFPFLLIPLSQIHILYAKHFLSSFTYF